MANNYQNNKSIFSLNESDPATVYNFEDMLTVKKEKSLNQSSLPQTPHAITYPFQNNFCPENTSQSLVLLTREEAYLKHYPQTDFLEGKILDLTQTLVNSKIDSLVRAKMADWILEVLSHFQSEFSSSTFFRSVLILDQFIKYTHLTLCNEDIHLAGVTSMYIASKYEDLFHIRIKDFTQRAAHGKFVPPQIRETELLILASSGYCISYKTLNEIVDFYFLKIFSFEETNLFLETKKLTLNFLLFCTFEVKFNEFDARLLVVGVVLVAMKYLKNSWGKSSSWVLKIKVLADLKRYEKQVREILMTQSPFSEVFADVKKISIDVSEFLYEFEANFVSCKQVFKHVTFKRSFLKI